MNKPRFRRYRHPFSASIKRRVKVLCKLDNWHGILAVLQVYFLILVTVGIPYLLSSFVSGMTDAVSKETLWWVGFAIAIPFIGCWQRALATIVHEATHHTIAKSERLSMFLGTFCSGYLIGQGWTAYMTSHGSHHRNLGDDHSDPDLAFHLSQGLYDPQSAATFIIRNIVSPLFLVKTPSKIADLVKNRLLSTDESLSEKICKFAFIAAITSLFVALGFGLEFVLFWIVPLVTTFPIANWYIELFEHFPLVRESNVDIHMTRNRWTGPIGKFMTGQLNENYHQVHHLFPGCPFWQLPNAHKVLMDDPNYRATQTRELGLVIPLLRGTPSIVLSLVRKVAQRSWVR